MVLSVLSALELDQKSSGNKFTLIEENNKSDGSFVVSTFLEEAVKKNDKIVILLFQNKIEHYFAIAQKLGYNLASYKEKGNVFVYDFLNTIYNGISCDNDVLKNLVLDVRQKISELQQSGSVTFVIDNIGNLLLYQFELKSCTSFVHYCFTLLHEYKNISIVCLMHTSPYSSEFTILLNVLRHRAYLNIIIDDLKTGQAVDVSGKLTVQWRSSDMMEWEEANEYHYQLLDKNVNVFAPGTKYL